MFYFKVIIDKVKTVSLGIILVVLNKNNLNE